MIDWDNPAEVLEHQRNLEWYVVTIKGTNESGEPETRDVKMEGDIEELIYIWAEYNHWTDVSIVAKQYIGKVPPKEQFN